MYIVEKSDDDSERPPGDQLEREDETATPSSPGMSNMIVPLSWRKDSHLISTHIHVHAHACSSLGSYSDQV